MVIRVAFGCDFLKAGLSSPYKVNKVVLKEVYLYVSFMCDGELTSHS